jgi:alpha-1,3-mannosyltransferase
MKSFEFDRVFFFKWTVNWKFLPEDLFVSKPWALMLLTFHLGSLGFLAVKWWKASVSQRGRANTREWLCWKKCTENNLHLSPEYILYTMFASNYIGIAFARTLHYQFYSWYFHALPMLHWLASMHSTPSKGIPGMCCQNIVAIFAVEYSFNVFPATEKSSLVLQLSHAFLLVKIFFAGEPSIAVGGYPGEGGEEYIAQKTK